MSNSLTTYGLDQDVVRWVEALSGQPSVTFMTNLNTMVSKLKAAAIWDQLDRFWLFATEDRQHAQICLKTLSLVTETASPIWTANQGYSSTAVTSYVDTNFNPSTQGVNFNLNNASVAYYSRTNVQESSIDFSNGDVGSGNNGSWLAPRYGDGNTYPRISASVTVTPSTQITATTGMLYVERVNSTTVRSGRNGSQINSISQTTTSYSNTTFKICGHALGIAINVSTRQIASIAFGSSSINQLKLYNIFQEFATRQGFNV